MPILKACMLNGKGKYCIKILTWCALIAYLIVPGSKIFFIDGIPFSPLEIVIFFIVVAGLIYIPWHKSRIMSFIFPILFSMLVVIKAISFFLIPYGWSLCVQSALDKETELAKKCDSSFIVSDLAFEGDQFPLHYFNNNHRFNFYGKDTLSRKNLPYSFNASTYLKPNEDSIISFFTTIDHVEFSLNSNKSILVPMEENIFTLKKGVRYSLELQYAVNRSEKHRLDSSLGSLQPYYKLNNQIITILYIIFSLIFIFLLFGYVFWHFFRSIILLSRKDIILFCISITSLLLLFIPISSNGLHSFLQIEPRPAMLTLAFAVQILCFFAIRIKSKIRACVLILLFLLTAMIYVSLVLPYGNTLLLPGGTDTLTHETMARDILSASSFRELLMAGEDSVFYYQPMYRYVLAFFHFIFGESLWGVFFVQTLLFMTFTFFVCYFFQRKKYYIAMITFLFILMAAALVNKSPFLLGLTTFQQAIASPLLLLSLMALLIIIEYRKRSYYLMFAGFFLGFSIATRTDYASALLILFLPFLYSQYSLCERTRLTLLLFFGFSIPVVFVVLRNYIVANTFTFFPTSAIVNLAPVFASNVPNLEKSISGLSLIMKIITHYSSHINDLIIILIRNVQSTFIGPLFIMKAMWYSFFVLAPFISVVGYMRYKEKFPLIFSILFIMLVIPNSFFMLHPEGSMTVIYGSIVMIIFSATMQFFYFIGHEIIKKS